ncbi:MAG: hypothetical protein OSA48_07370 [Akkermansiaceae bacterium]|nr:hypothetical protein [Akkermansiaceae bacterium]
MRNGKGRVFGLLGTMLGQSVDMKTGESSATGEVSESGVATYNTVRAIGAPFPKTRKTTLLMTRLVNFDEELGSMVGVDLIFLMMGGLRRAGSWR